MRQQFGKTMKLHEIYEGYVRFRTVRQIADRILNIENNIKWNGGCKEEDWKWLLLSCEDEALMRKLSSEASRYSNFNRMDYGDGEMLRTASEFAKALRILNQTKQKIDDDSKTRILQATDEIVQSDKMRELIKQQAYIDLQNAYTQAESEGAERVGALADMATDI